MTTWAGLVVIRKAPRAAHTSNMITRHYTAMPNDQVRKTSFNNETQER